MPLIAQPSGLGWKVRLQQKRYSSFITLEKAVIRGMLLKKHDPVYYYLITLADRKALLVLLDKKPLEEANTILIEE